MAQTKHLSEYQIVASVEGQQKLKELATSLRGLESEVRKLKSELKASESNAAAMSGKLDALSTSAKKANQAFVTLGSTASGSFTGLSLSLDSAIGKLAAANVAVREFLRPFAAALEARAQVDQLQATLSVGNKGDLRQTAEDIKFLKAETDRLGLAFTSTATLFAKMNIAALGAGLSVEQSREVFQSFGGAIGKLNLSADSSNQIFFALQQMFSKGTVSSEELKGQLGEKLPDAMGIASRALGVTTAELNKMLEQGEVITSTFLPKFAKEMNRTFGLDTTSRVETAAAALNRFDNAITELQQNFVSGGVGNALISVTETIAANMNLIAGAAVLGGISKLIGAVGAFSASQVAAATATAASQRALITEAAAKVASAEATVAYTAAKLREAQAVVASTTGMRALTVATTQLIPAQRAATAATTALATAQAGLATVSGTATAKAAGAFGGVGAAAGRLLSFLGGPWAVGITTAATLAYTAYETFGSKSTEAMDDAVDASQKAMGPLTATHNQRVKLLDDEIQKLRDKNSELRVSLGLESRQSNTGPGSSIESTKAAVQDLKAELDLVNKTGFFRGAFVSDARQAVVQIGKEISDLQGGLNTYNSELAKTKDLSAQAFNAEFLKKYGTAAQKMESEIAEARAEAIKQGTELTAQQEALIRKKYEKESAGAKKAATELKNLTERLDDYVKSSAMQLAQGNKLTESQKIRNEFEKIYGEILPDVIEKKLQVAAATEREIDASEALKKALEEEAKERERNDEQRVKATEDLRKSNTALEQEIERIGLKAAAIAELDAVESERDANRLRREAEADRLDGDTVAFNEKIRQAEEFERRAVLIRKKGAKEAAEAIAEENRKANLELVDDIIKTFGDIAVKGGKEAGKNIVKAIQVELQKAVFKVAVQAALGIDAKGNTTGGGLSGLLGAAANQSIGAAISNGFSQVATAAGASIFGSAGAYAAAVPGLTSAAAGSQAALLAAQTAEFGAAGLTSTAAAGGSAAASSLAAAGPYIAAAILAYQLFKSKKISATSLGGADVLFSGQGRELGVSTGMGGADNEFARSIINPLKDQYVGLTKALGGVQQAFTLTAAGNTGRQGQNPNFAIKFGINNQTFSSTNGEVALNEANVGTESLRALLGLLAQTDLPDNIDSVVRGLNLTNASLQEMEATLGLVQAIDFVNDNFGLLGDNLGMLANASSDAITQFVQAVGGLESLSAGLANFNDKFLNEGEKQALLLGQVTKAFTDLNIPLPQTREEFKNLVQQQNLLTESGAQTYAALLKLTDSIDALYPAAQAAEKALREQEAAASERRSIIAGRRAQEENLAQAAQLERERAEEIKKANAELRDAALAASDFASAFEIMKAEIYSSFRREEVNSAIVAEISAFRSLESQRIATLISKPLTTTPMLSDKARNYIQEQGELAAQQFVGALDEALGPAFDNVIAQFASNASSQRMVDFAVLTPVQRARSINEAAVANQGPVTQLVSQLNGLNQSSTEAAAILKFLSDEVFHDFILTVEDANRAVEVMNSEVNQAMLRNAAGSRLTAAGLEQITFYFGDLSAAASRFAEDAQSVSGGLRGVSEAMRQTQGITTAFKEAVNAFVDGLSMLTNGLQQFKQADFIKVDKANIITRAAELAQEIVGGATFDIVQQSIERTVAKGDANGYAAALVQISDAFAKGTINSGEYATAFQQASRQFTGVAQQIEQAEQDLEQARQNQIQTLQSGVSELESSTQATLGFADSIRELRNNLILAMTSPADSAAVNGALFTDALSAVRSGDTSKLGELSSTASAFVDAARSSSSDYVEFIKRTAFVQSELQSLEAGFMSQYEIDLASLENSKAMLDSLTNQTDVLTQINESTLSVAQAVMNLESLQKRFVLDTTSLFGGVPQFANGWLVTSPTLAMIGEGRLNEAVVPLPDGRSIPVQMMGQGQRSNEILIQEIRALKAEVAQLRESNSAENRALVGNTAKATQILVKGTENGTKDFAGNQI